MITYNIDSSYIYLHDLHFHAFHGVGEQEQIVGNDFRIDIRLQCNVGDAIRTDNVADTISYAEVYNLIAEEMKEPSRLLENVAGRIIQQIFVRFPLAQHIDMTLSKRNPPMGADIAEAGVELHCSRTKND